MKTPPLSLTEVFNKLLAERFAAEKKYIKSFTEMSDAVLTDELHKALSPEQTDQENHLSRLSLILESQKLKAGRITAVIDDELLKMSTEVCGFMKQKSIMKDIQILHCVQVIEQIKITNYDALYQIALELKLEQAAELLEQTLKDNKNTQAYLSQIAQNIIYPAANKST
ncbi:DUF892 family protein [Pedobacter metabolipauper]|uniref:Ferritin-like metal-binding protein YciE n=1 Tax=Pedobacter metabolipauper TaxID=425513 RepID=A0A4R6STW3_9SPHI|nr:DUF892 family protein [Pedobacter metabolipauper]TDQ08210.1 ferritin-like metal-binding protein YciE [Pedobacter metabolipauper]